MNGLPTYNYANIKAKVGTYGDKVYTNFCGVNVLENYIECESFTVISIDSLLVYENKYYLQVIYKIKDNGMIDYLDDNIFETDEN